MHWCNNRVILSGAACFLFLLACQKEPNQRIDNSSNTSSDSLNVLYFTPDSAHVGDSVLVWGMVFDTVADANVVTIHSVQQEVLYANDSVLLFRVMPGTTSGQIDVTAKGQQVHSQKTLFIDSSVVSQLAVLSFSPDSAYVGDTVRLTGKGFSSEITGNLVFINSVQQDVVFASDTALWIRVSTGTTTGNILVTANGQTAGSSASLVIISQPPPVALTIQSFSPDIAKVGDTVTIVGTGFGVSGLPVTVTINGTGAEVISVSPGVLQIKVNPGTTSGKIYLTENGQTAISVKDLVIVQAGGPWTRKKDFEGQWSDFASATGISAGNRGFYFRQQELWEYLPQQDLWDAKAKKPSDGDASYSFSFVLNGQVFIGYGGNTSLDSVRLWAYNLSTDTWARKKNLPITPRIAPFGFAGNNVGYVGGGQVSFDANMNAHDVWQYNPADDSWTRVADFPGPWTIGISGWVIDGQAYVYDAGVGFPQAPTMANGKGRLWKYETASNTWIEKATNPGGDSTMSATTFSIGSKGYVALSKLSSSTAAKNDLWMYDPATNNWTKRTDVAGGLRWFGSAFAIGNKGYVGLGTGSTVMDQKNDFWEYNPE